MNKQQRIDELIKIKNDNSSVVKSGITIRYDGEFKTFTTHKIPLECLIYNKYNGRIGAAIKSYEKQFRELDPENSKDKDIIIDFLWKSKKDRNEKTERSLATDHQVTYGVVTKDGIIIDGNRRAMLLNKIYNERDLWQKQGIDVDHCKYFEAIILDEEFGAKEIMKLETTLQMGQDEKLDYNAIEKYLKCKDLLSVGYSEQDISTMMSERIGEIKKYQSRLKTMESYLNYWSYDGLYTMLDKREDQFITLNKFLSTYKNGNGAADWPYQDFDVSELEQIAYNYIRAEYEGKEFRKLFEIFKKGDIWKRFKERYNNATENYKEQLVSEIRESTPDEDISEQLIARDTKFKETLTKEFVESIIWSDAHLRESKEIDKPFELLTKCINYLNSIDTNSDGFSESGIYEKIVEINKKSFELKKMFD